MTQAGAARVLVWRLALGGRARAVPGGRGAGQRGQLCLAGARQQHHPRRRTDLAGEPTIAPPAVPVLVTDVACMSPVSLVEPSSP